MKKVSMSQSREQDNFTPFNMDDEYEEAEFEQDGFFSFKDTKKK